MIYTLQQPTKSGMAVVGQGAIRNGDLQTRYVCFVCRTVGLRLAAHRLFVIILMLLVLEMQSEAAQRAFRPCRLNEPNAGWFDVQEKMLMLETQP
jgi:predicted LPLAT superfamily acyltransferase